MSHNIIPITKQIIGNEEANSVNARDLYKSLNIKKDFSNWIKAQINSLGFEENIDYIVFTQKGENPNGGRGKREYILTLDTAKHIALASRTPKGKEVRRYFIEIEKAYNSGNTLAAKEIAKIKKDVLELKELPQLLSKKDKEIISLQKELIALLKPSSLVSPAYKNKMWTKPEDAKLAKLYNNGVKLVDMPKYINRSFYAIKDRLAVLKSRGIIPQKPPKMQDLSKIKTELATFIKETIQNEFAIMLPVVKEAASKQITFDEAVQMLQAQGYMAHERYIRGKK